MNSTALSRFRGPVWILALLVMVLGLLAPSATVSASAATTGIIGTVTNSDGVAVSGLSVNLLQRVSDADGIRYQSVGTTTTTNASGAYAFEVPAGTYRIFTAASTAYASTFYPSVSYVDQASDVTVTADQVIDNRNITVNRPGAISGRVLRALDRAPVAGATATLERLRTSPSPATWVAVGPTATTAANGTYQINQVSPSSNYRVRITGAGFSAQLTPSGNFGTSVSASQTTPVPDVLLFPDDSGVIRGRVTNAQGQPVINVQVRPRQLIVTPQGSTWAVVGDPVATGVDGQYAVAVPAGTYRLQFSGPQLQTTYYAGSDTVEQGDDVPVFAGAFSDDNDVTVVPAVNGSNAVFNIEPPAVLGDAGGGQTLIADPGTWSPATSKVYSYEWQMCTTTDPFDCDPASGANTGPTYLIPKNNTITNIRYRVLVTPTNAFDELSAPTGPTPGPTGLLFVTYPVTKFENRGAPVVTGSATPGSTLTATTGKWSSTPTSVSLQWYADNAPIAGATGTTYTVKPADVGSRIAVLAQATFNGASALAASVPTAPVELNTIQHLVAPRVTGVARVGDTLSTDQGSWSETGLSYSYLWFADDLAIPGATNATFAPTASQVGKRIRVLVQVSKPGFASAAALSSRTLQVVQAGAGPDGQVLANVSAPTISGTPIVGNTVTATPGTWSVDPTSYKYQWRRNGVAIANATTQNLLLTDDLAGASLSVSVTAVKADYPEKTADSAPVTVAAGTITNTARPAVSGTTTVGRTLSATTGSWSITGLSFSYQWRNNGAAISGATGPTLTLNGQTNTGLISVDVTASRPGYTPATASSQAVGPVSPGTITVAGNPAVAGTARYGSLLRAVPASSSPAVSKSYQWLRNGAPIPGAIGSTYRPGAADLATRLSVRVVYSAPGYTPVARTSAFTGIVKTAPSLSISASKGARKSTFRITVNAPGVNPPNGVVELRSGGKVVARGTLASGRVVLSVSKSRGLKKVSVVYLGEARVLATTRSGVKVP